MNIIKSAVLRILTNFDIFEDLLALTDKNYLNSIKQAREDYQKGKVFTHEEVFK